MKTNWIVSGQVSMTIVRNDLRLGIACAPLNECWSVMALVIPANLEEPQEVFDQHSHKAIGVYSTLSEALKAGESYAQAWLKDHKQTKSRACDCGEIDGPLRGCPHAPQALPD